MALQLRFILTFLYILVTGISFGQILHTNPYKLDFLNFHLEHSQQEIKEFKVKKVTSKEVEIKTDGTQKQVPNDDAYFIEFNTAGNPTHYQYTYLIPTYKKKNMVTEIYEVFFDYDSLNNLIHIHESESHPGSSEMYNENDTYYLYNKKNNLIHQTITQRHLYDPTLQRRGLKYGNDTTTINYSLNYDNLNKVTVVFKQKEESFNHELSVDTLTFNRTFDSIFISDMPNGEKVDSLGRVISSTIYSSHAKLLGGQCISFESPNDIIITYFYNAKGNVIKAERHSRTGNFINRRLWNYSEDGLLQSTQEENSTNMIIYEYEFY